MCLFVFVESAETGVLLGKKKQKLERKITKSSRNVRVLEERQDKQ